MEIIIQVFAQNSSSKSPKIRAQNVGNGENGSNFVFGIKVTVHWSQITHRDRDVSRPRSRRTRRLTLRDRDQRLRSRGFKSHPFAIASPAPRTRRSKALTHRKRKQGSAVAMKILSATEQQNHSNSRPKTQPRNDPRDSFGIPCTQTTYAHPLILTFRTQ